MKVSRSRLFSFLQQHSKADQLKCNAEQLTKWQLFSLKMRTSTILSEIDDILCIFSACYNIMTALRKFLLLHIFQPIAIQPDSQHCQAVLSLWKDKTFVVLSYTKGWGWSSNSVSVSLNRTYQRIWLLASIMLLFICIKTGNNREQEYKEPQGVVSSCVLSCCWSLDVQAPTKQGGVDKWRIYIRTPREQRNPECCDATPHLWLTPQGKPNGLCVIHWWKLKSTYNKMST